MEQYKFVKELGQGGFGHVWLVRSVSSKKQVLRFYVLKQINLQNSTKRQQRAAYLEVKLLSTLEHPNIVSYLDSFYNSDGSLFIIMGYCERGDLYNYIRKRDNSYFEEKQVVNWFVQLCLALRYLHEKNILHRDLKTKNLYLTRGKLIKIGDLGIACVLNGGNMAMTMIGTPFYMSPEVLSSQPYNHKTDIWGLGCCLYEMMTLKQAFIADDFPSLYKKVLMGKVSAMPDMYSEDLKRMVLTMLSSNPNERPSVAQILLNPFIRKNIQLFLEDSSEFLNDLVKKKLDSCEPSVARPATNGMDSVDAAKPSLNNQPKDQENNSESKNPAHKGKALVITVPDINGNGDGNDNSQHRYALNRTKCVASSLSKSAFTKSISGSGAKENINPKACFTSKSKSAQNMSSSVNVAQNNSASMHSICSYAEKRRGERSMEFLINLTYTLKLARNSSVSSDTYTIPNLPDIGRNIPLSSGQKYLSAMRSLSECHPRSKLISPSVKSDSAMLSSKNNIDAREEITSNIVLPEVSKILFPVRGSSANGKLAEKSPYDLNIDNNLLTEILSCDKSSTTNTAARQRRREKLKASCLTKSAPASVESLPMISKDQL